MLCQGECALCVYRVVPSGWKARASPHGRHGFPPQESEHYLGDAARTKRSIFCLGCFMARFLKGFIFYPPRHNYDSKSCIVVLFAPGLRFELSIK